MTKPKNAAAQELGSLGGQATKRGKWWERLTAEERMARARAAGQSRWKNATHEMRVRQGEKMRAGKNKP